MSTHLSIGHQYGPFLSGSHQTFNFHKILSVPCTLHKKLLCSHLYVSWFMPSFYDLSTQPLLHGIGLISYVSFIVYK
jgi:hypothetical protein